MEEEISLVEFVKLLRKKIGLITNMMFLGLLFSATYTFFIATPTYSATTQLLVNRTQETEVIQRSDIDTNVQLINTYSDIIRNPIILDPAIDILDIEQTTEELSNKINVTTSENSQVFSLQVTDDNPYIAAEKANTISTVFKENLNSIMNVDNVTIISKAVADTNPVSPNNVLNIAIGILMGIMVGIGIVTLLEYMDTSVKDDKFIVDKLGWTNLGTISKMSPEEMKAEIRPSVPQKTNESRISRSRV